MIARLIRIAALAAGGLCIALAHAQPYPTKPVRWIVPYPPGGSSDLVARIVANRLSEWLSQQFIIDNRAGMSGGLGTELAARAAPDGYTLLLANSAPLAINPSVYQKLRYDPVRDFAPVTRLATAPTILVIHPSIAARTLPEMVALAKAKPGFFKYGTGGPGTPAHLTGELFKLTAGIDLLHVPYKGTGQSVNDLIGGQIDMVFASPPTAMAYMKSGKLRGLAVTSIQRSALAPGLPTAIEAGVPGFELATWWGATLPARSPPAIVAQLNGEMRKALALPDTRERFAALGIEPAADSPAEFKAFLVADIAKFAKLVKQIGLQPE